MRLDRRRLRRLIKEEYNKVLKEMYMGGGGHMGGGHMGGGHMAMGPDHPDYEMCAEAIMQGMRNCMMRRVNSSDEMGIQACCMEACEDFGVTQHLNYVCGKVANMLRSMGM